MKRYEVQQFTLCDGWINTWNEYDDDNNEIPLVFDSYEEAEEELENNLLDCVKEFRRGNIESPYEAEEFRIVEVTQ
jgi:hypothetical protein